MDFASTAVTRMRLLAGWAAIAALAVLALVAGHADSARAQTFTPQLAVSVENPEPGSASDVVADFDLADGDVNFAAVVSFIPPEWGVVTGDKIPIGTQTGVLDAQSVLGIANAACGTQLPVRFEMRNASLNLNDTIDFDDTDFDRGTLDPALSLGEKNLAEYEASGDVGTTANFADDIEYVTREGDTIEQVAERIGLTVEQVEEINFLDAAEPLEVGTIIGNGIPDGVEHYPDFLTRVFKNDDTDEIMQPIRRSAGITTVAGTPVLLQFLIFPPGTELPARGRAANEPRLPSDEALGYPSVTVLQSIGDPDATPAPSVINDFCTPLATVNRSFGQERDEDGITVKPDGMKFFVNPQDGNYTWTTAAFGQRDADGDTYENSLDTCPFDANIGDPRITGDGDIDGDGLDQACDPNDNPATGGTISDEDGDGYGNRNDNCPLDANGQEEDNQADADLDQIGDACDPNPDDPSAQGAISSSTPTAQVMIGTGGGAGGPPTEDECPDCYRGTFATPTPGQGTPTPGVPDNGEPDAEDDGAGATIAIIAGVIAAIVVLGGGAFLLMRRRSA